MCFSAQASFIAASTIGIIGCLSLSKVRNYKSIFFASMPAWFAMQQAAEGFVWLGLNNGEQWGTVLPWATLVFLFFAGVFWPTWIPFSLYILEKSATRKKWLGVLCIAGTVSAFIAITLWWFMGIAPLVADHHITYQFSTLRLTDHQIIWLNRFALLLYATATIGSFFISSVPAVWTVGLLIGTAFVVSHFFYYIAFGSVWCFFAALISIATYFVMREYNVRHHYH